MKILAVDVGIIVCGYCVCEVRGNDVDVIKEEEIKPSSKNTLPQKLNQIYDILKTEAICHNIRAVAVETLYSHHKHPTTLGVLAQVRGVVALLSHKLGVSFHEYSSTRARKSLVGKGNADSQRVKRVAENITNRKFLSVHTADAYSLAVSFSHENKLKKIFDEAGKI